MKILDAVIQNSLSSRGSTISVRFAVENGIGRVYIDGCPEPILVGEGRGMRFSAEATPLHYWAEWEDMDR